MKKKGNNKQEHQPREIPADMHQRHQEQAKQVMNGEITPLAFVQSAMADLLGLQESEKLIETLDLKQIYDRPMSDAEKSVIAASTKPKSWMVENLFNRFSKRRK